MTKFPAASILAGLILLGTAPAAMAMPHHGSHHQKNDHHKNNHKGGHKGNHKGSHGHNGKNHPAQANANQQQRPQFCEVGKPCPS